MSGEAAGSVADFTLFYSDPCQNMVANHGRKLSKQLVCITPLRMHFLRIRKKVKKNARALFSLTAASCVFLAVRILNLFSRLRNLKNPNFFAFSLILFAFCGAHVSSR